MSITRQTTPLPRWMKVPLPKGENYSQVKNLIIEKKLNTICSSGNCPNKGECWNAGTATFMILGEKCTRNCRFCYVKVLKPDPVDWDEPARLAQTIKILKLKHAVITSVARDDLADGGASFWALTIRKVKLDNPTTTMEVLIPDFSGEEKYLDLVIKEKPDVISHNVETIERISPRIRSLATYRRSLAVLSYLASKGVTTKSGLMLGLGETINEVLETLRDLKQCGVEIVTIGQYLPPSDQHAELVEYVKPEFFEFLKVRGLEMGFRVVESGPLVRSSYHAEKHVKV